MVEIDMLHFHSFLKKKEKWGLRVPTEKLPPGLNYPSHTNKNLRKNNHGMDVSTINIQKRKRAL